MVADTATSEPRGLAARWPDALGLGFGSLACAWLTLHFLVQSGWALGQVRDALPEGLQADGLRQCGGLLRYCALGLEGRVEAATLSGGLAEVSLGLLPPRVEAVRLRLGELAVAVETEPRPLGEPRPLPPDPVALLTDLAGLAQASVRVDRLWIRPSDEDASGWALTFAGARLEGGRVAAVTLTLGAWDLALPDGRGLGGGGLRATISAVGRLPEGMPGDTAAEPHPGAAPPSDDGEALAVAKPDDEAPSLVAQVSLPGPVLSGAFEAHLTGGPERRTLSARGSIEARGTSLEADWALRLDGFELRPVALGGTAEPPVPVDVTVSWQAVAGEFEAVQLGLGTGHLRVVRAGLLPVIEATVEEIAGGPLRLEGGGCAELSLGRLTLAFDKRLSGTLEGLALEDCRLETGMIGALRADLTIEGSLLRAAVSGQVAGDGLGAIDGALTVRRSLLGGRVTLAAEGTATLREGPVRAALLGGLEEAARAAEALGAAGATTSVKPAPGSVTGPWSGFARGLSTLASVPSFAVTWEREDRAWVFRREGVSVALEGGDEAAWDGAAWVWGPEDGRPQGPGAQPDGRPWRPAPGATEQ
jgi:hypothetical protein